MIIFVFKWLSTPTLNLLPTLMINLSIRLLFLNFGNLAQLRTVSSIFSVSYYKLFCYVSGVAQIKLTNILLKPEISEMVVYG